MSKDPLSTADVIGLLHPSIDAHTLGVSSVCALLEECGLRCLLADAGVAKAVMSLSDPASRSLIRQWLKGAGITSLGFSYRLDPDSGVGYFRHLLHFLREERLWAEQGGILSRVFFAGLPLAAERVRRECPEVDAVFLGDESPSQTLQMLGVPAHLIPGSILAGSEYDEARLGFGRRLIAEGRHLSVVPPARGTYPEFGSPRDSLAARLLNRRLRGLPPLLRAHVGPYLQDRQEALRLYDSWVRTLAADGFLDVLSIGTSQLSQQDFQGNWEGKPDGGGVPLHSPEEFACVWRAARPMLVRSYAGTSRVPEMAAMLEENIHIAWHALSFWWFCQIDGRGDNHLLENLRQHCATLDYIARTGKPFEANVPHHFSFRGGDDVTYVASVLLAAKLARKRGIRCFVLQLMLNTPKSTWGIQDLAKARAAVMLLRQLEDKDLRIIVQMRGGLDYFSPDPQVAKAQLAAVSVLMKDVGGGQDHGPDIIHVVGYSEGFALADPAVVRESCQITLAALELSAGALARGDLPDMRSNLEVEERCRLLLEESSALVQDIERRIPEPYTPEGLYAVFAHGYLPVPYLWRCREEFPKAVNWNTRPVQGGVQVVDSLGRRMSMSDRLALVHQGLLGGRHV